MKNDGVPLRGTIGIIAEGYPSIIHFSVFILQYSLSPICSPGMPLPAAASSSPPPNTGAPSPGSTPVWAWPWPALSRWDEDVCLLLQPSRLLHASDALGQGHGQHGGPRADRVPAQLGEARVSFDLHAQHALLRVLLKSYRRHASLRPLKPSP